ncbi:protein LYRIC isoform X2 [Pseudophryne corroboree]|uniref:protein LYRIC isoform X2 n=1 Tax=Pseudophryne corroboree TaxID=495146 RepID=UPI0030812D2A
MGSSWQEAAAQQAEEVSARLRQLLTTGLGLLRTELGLELGLQPQKYPSWVFLAVPASLAVLLLLLLCAAGRGSPSKKRVAQPEREPADAHTKAPVPVKAPAKVEEAKKKSKKKPPEKAKLNGRPVKVSEEESPTTVKKDSPKPLLLDAEKKNEKIKKTKKKPKSDAKQTQSPNQDKKEAEEGNWETKISNKEKRQQRRRDKGADSDVILSESTMSLGDAFTLASSHSANVRKSKGPSEVSAVNGSGWNEKPAKAVSPQLVEEKWVLATTSAGKKKAEPPCTWNQGSADTNGKVWSAPWSERSIFPGIAPWSTVEARINSSEQRPPPFSSIGLNSAVSAATSEPVPQPSASDSQWEAAPTEPSVDDEWSGLNGLNSGDLSSDWNAPAEEWGNYGEEEPESAPQIEELEQEVPKVSDDEKEREEGAGQGSVGSKTKKKKKKKKKQGEESGSPTQEAEGTRNAVDNYREDFATAPPPPVNNTVFGKSNELKEAVQETPHHTVFIESPVSVMQNISEKSPSQVQQPKEASTSVPKQNSVPSQAKSEESWESPKQVKKKKKARRET